MCTCCGHPAARTQASTLHTNTHRRTLALLKQLRVTVLILCLVTSFHDCWKKRKKKSTVSNCMLLLSVLSSYLYGTTNPAQPVHPPPSLTNAVALIGPASFTTGSGAESWTERARRLIETSPNARSPAVPRSLVPTLSCCLELTFSSDNICPRQTYSGLVGGGVLSKKVQRGRVIKGASVWYSF